MPEPPEQSPPPVVVGRYAIFEKIASGGMATVHLGRLLGPIGFARTVAIKRLHAQFAADPGFVTMFLDEARLSARVRHPNVVTTLDVVVAGEELLLVMEYIHGESLARVIRTAHERGENVPMGIVVALLAGMLHGLHAAHEATTERGCPLALVHRDISPQNVLVGADGVSRVLDFGIAKAASRLQTTEEGQLKGKVAYMAPEQLEGEPVDRRTDIYAAAIVLWETLTGLSLFPQETPGQVLRAVLEGNLPDPSSLAPHVPPSFDDIVRRGLSRAPAGRYSTAREMAVALERVFPPATPHEVSVWVGELMKQRLARRQQLVARVEGASLEGLAPTEPPAGGRLERVGRRLLDAEAITHVPALPGAAAAHGASDSAFPEPQTRVLARSRPGRLAAALLVGLSLFALLAFSLGRVSSAPAAASSASALASAAAAASASALPADTEPPAPPAAASATSSAATPARSSSPALRPPRRSGADRSSCDPPYTFENGGIKRFKPQCI